MNKNVVKIEGMTQKQALALAIEAVADEKAKIVLENMLTKMDNRSPKSNSKAKAEKAAADEAIAKEILEKMEAGVEMTKEEVGALAGVSGQKAVALMRGALAGKVVEGKGRKREGGKKPLKTYVLA